MLNWSPAQDHDAQFVGQCLRDGERPRLERFTGHRAQLAFIGVHNGALGSAVLRVDGQPIGMLCGNPCSVPGLRTAFLGLTPAAEQLYDLEGATLDLVRQHVQGDALGLVAMTPGADRVQARWLMALGLQKAPPAWAGDLAAPIFYTVRPGAELLIREYIDGLDGGAQARATWH